MAWYFSISSFVGLGIFGTSIGLPTVNNNCLFRDSIVISYLLSRQTGQRFLLGYNIKVTLKKIKKQ